MSLRSPFLPALFALVLTACGGDVGPVLAAEPDRASFQPVSAFNGFTVIAPLRDSSTYLVDMEGHVVHEWPSEFWLGGSVYLLDDGSIYRVCREPGPELFTGGGQAGRIQRIAWDGTVTWDYLYADGDHLQHHDIEPLPNGNLLMIAWERKEQADAAARGRDPELNPSLTFWPDYLVEIVPEANNQASVVWEWHAWDHIIQDFDSTKSHFGDVAAHPELIDINGDRAVRQMTEEEIADEEAMLEELGYIEDDGDEPEVAAAEEEKEPELGGRDSDWMHSNAVEYQPELDLIAISVRRFDEIWVIDHSTTTAEAASHKGGRHGKGGDLLYRYGNPRAHGAGGPEDQRLFGQHNIQWIPAGYMGAGNFIVYNNGDDIEERAWSSIDEWRMPMGADGSILPPVNGRFGPTELAWTYEAENKEDFYSSFISGVQRLPNGNTLICCGQPGWVFEVTPAGKRVWEYKNELGEEEVPEDAPPHVRGVNRTALFRATRVAPAHPGLAAMRG